MMVHSVSVFRKLLTALPAWKVDEPIVTHPGMWIAVCRGLVSHYHAPIPCGPC
jgi:hypothetical protein